MSKHGSASIALLLSDGVSLLGSKPKDISSEHASRIEDSAGLGDAWGAALATGMQSASLAIGEAFYDAGTGLTHEHYQASPGVSRIVCYGFEGDALGAAFVGHAGTITTKYKVLSKLGDLTKAGVEYVISGARDEGVILCPLRTADADFDTEATSVDHGASTSNGGVAYQQVTDFDSLDGYVGAVLHSADDSTYAELVAFADVTSGPEAQRVEVSGTVNRYLAYEGDLDGSGELTVWAGFARS